MLPLLGAAALVLVAGASWGSASPAGERAAGKARPEEGSSPGREALKSPQNVNVSIIDDNITLRWERSPENGRNVTFSAYYRIPFETDWTELPTCQHVTASECTFSSDPLNVYEKFQLRVRAERGNDVSAWYEVDSFVPNFKAQIGPPELYLEAEDKAIKINLSPPGTEDSAMWATELSAFRYNIVIWDNSSMEQSTEFKYPRYNIYNLSPNTTYCLKVRAVLDSQIKERKVGLYTPVHCINTTAENKLPPPEHLQVSALPEFYVLRWNYSDDPSEQVTFRAQWLYAYLKRYPGSHADKWTQIQECENVKTTHCVIPRTVFMDGFYYIRVQASKGNATSFWSEEKNFYAAMQTVRPVVKMKSNNDGSLHVYIGSAKDPENKPVDQDYPRIYEIIFWENSSKVETTYRKKTDFTISHLKMLTIYCVKARAIVEKWNNSSEFSDISCEETKPGSTSKNALIGGILGGFFFALFSIVAVIYLVIYLWKKIRYVFFPSNKPPSTLNEDFSRKSLRNLLLVTSEEQTERCYIIENTNTVTVTEDIPPIEENHKQYSSQTSEDSGNFSNEEKNKASDQE